MSVATDMLAAYMAAETAVLQGQETRVDLGDGRGYRALQMADLAAIIAGRKDWQARVAAEMAPPGPRVGGLGFAVARLDRTF